MNIFEIYIAFLTWGDGGKRRPVLVLAENVENVTVYNITTRYENKSEVVRSKYCVIQDWQQAGLDKQSYIDTNQIVTLPRSSITSSSQIGKLTAADEKRLIEFISK